MIHKVPGKHAFKKRVRVLTILTFCILFSALNSCGGNLPKDTTAVADDTTAPHGDPTTTSSGNGDNNPPPVYSRETVFVSGSGQGSRDGSSPENASSIQDALGMTKENGGTIVICGKVNLEERFYFPSDSKRITITSLHEGTDYRDAGASLTLTGETGFYGDYTLENIDLIAGSSDIFIYFQYNNITIGDGVRCTRGAGVTNDMGIICGYKAVSISYQSSYNFSCHEDAEVIVKSGTWSYIRGGNRRTKTDSAFGTVDEGKTFVIRVEGGTFTLASGNDFSSAVGMNSVDGTVYMEISGGEFRAGLNVLSRTGSNTNEYPVSVSGRVIMKITGGTFRASALGVCQPTTTQRNKISGKGEITVCVTGGNFTFSNFTLNGIAGSKLILADSVSSMSNSGFSSVIKSTESCDAVIAPALTSLKQNFTSPPKPDKPPVTGELTAEEEKSLTSEAAEKLALVRKLETHSGVDTYQKLRTLHDPDNSYSLKSVVSAKLVKLLTGEYSINKTLTNYCIGGAGGGYMIDCGDFVLVAFGDNEKEGGLGAPWRSNTLAYTTDFDYTDGIIFDGFYSCDTADYKGHAEEFLPSEHKEGVEMSKIPTGGIKVGDNLYFCYMSVNRWSKEGEDGVWKCNYGGLAISRDMGRTWETPSDLRWPECGFDQLYPIIDGDWVYIFGVPGGRRGAIKLMRAPLSQIENRDAYEYMTGRDENGNPVFTRGEEAMKTDYAIIDPCAGGLAIMYNEYLGEWTMFYCTPQADNIRFGSIVMRTAKTPAGVWSDAVLVMSQKSYGSVYEPRVCARYSVNGGQKIMMICSRWNVYNSLIFEIEFSKK